MDLELSRRLFECIEQWRYEAEHIAWVHNPVAVQILKRY